VLAALALVHALEPVDSDGAPGRTGRAGLFGLLGRRGVQRASWTVAWLLVGGLLALFAVNAREVVAVTLDALAGGRA